MAQGRSLWGQIFQNFIASFKPRKIWGELKGKDYLGTEYYEGTNRQGYKRPARWFSPSKENQFDQEIPPEWEAWLRYRRKDPPTEEEIQMNILKMNQRIENAKNLEKPKSADINETDSNLFRKPEFPTYDEYSIKPQSKGVKES